jgi:hypothetical protein
MTASEIKTIVSSNEVLAKVRKFANSGITGLVKDRSGCWMQAGGCGFMPLPCTLQGTPIAVHN